MLCIKFEVEFQLLLWKTSQNVPNTALCTLTGISPVLC